MAYLCVGHQSTMMACCPDEGHEAQLSLSAVEQSSEQVAATLLRPSFHGPPVYLTTLRVRR